VSSLLVTGRLPEPSLRRILYAQWRVDVVLTSRLGLLVAVVTCPDDTPYGFGPAFQAQRIRSLGTVGVLEEWEEADVLAAVLRTIPRDTRATAHLT
jgi:hypothetical protein